MNTIANHKILQRAVKPVETLEQQAERLFPDAPYAPAGTVEHNRKSWLAAVRYLGHQWLGKVHASRDGIALAVAAAGSLPFLVIDIAQKVIG